MRTRIPTMSSRLLFLALVVGSSVVVEVVLGQNNQDCSQLETDVIQDVIALGQDSKNKLFDTIERLQSRLNGAKQCTDSEWRINYGHLSYYKIGDGTPEGVGCRETPFTGMDWPWDTNDKGVNHQDYPAATVREGTCGSGLVLQCTPEPIPAKYSYDRPTNTCPRVYCVTAADPLVAGEYWEDISNFVQDQVPRYIKGAIDTKKYQECRIPPPPAATETEPPITTDCYGEIITTEETTKLDLFHAEIKTNTLHQPGGELRYGNIGIVRDQPVDLVVTVDSGEYTDIAQVWQDRNKIVDEMNGISGEFGKLNLQTVPGRPQSGQGNFKFCFHDTQTDQLTKVDTFRWTVFDFDERGDDRTLDGIGLKEKMLMDITQAHSYQLSPNRDASEIRLSCEDGATSMPCLPGIRTVFHSSTSGTGSDNPKDPNNMTDLQKARSVTFTFKGTDCWTFTYDHYCPVEQDHTKVFPLGYDKQDNKNVDNKKECRGYTGGNFLFSGDADEIIEEGECITPPPTTATPTETPSATPTPAPTKTPTKPPSDSPTQSPSSSPTTGPSRSPTASPSSPPTSAPSPSPTSTPTDEPTVSPSVSPSSAPSKSPTSSPTAGPTALPSASPTLTPTANPTASPSNSPSSSPSSEPTTAQPSSTPSAAPSGSFFPSSAPTDGPTVSNAPSSSPTSSPSERPTGGPTVSPSSSPSSQPSSKPSSSPSRGPSASPSDSPSTSPSLKPSGSPSVTPSNSPSLNPSKNLSSSPSDGPSLNPSKNPSSSPSDAPVERTLPPVAEAITEPPHSAVDCPEDVTVVRQNGSTEFPNDVVKILKQDVDSVTVALYQNWSTASKDMSPATPIDHIYLYYHVNSFDYKCYGWDSVDENQAPFATIDLKCDVLKPRAIMEICVADDLKKNVLTEQDNADIRQCCDPPPDLLPGVTCYYVKINCVSECIEVGNELPN